jgi:hypothetical protein
MNARLDLPEVAYRTGLLLASGLLLVDALGSPLDRGIIGVPAVLLSLLAVATLLFQARTLGDWRQWPSQFLALALTAVLWVPLAAALSPRLGESFMPDVLETPTLLMLQYLGEIPGAAQVGAVISAALSFTFLVLATLALAVAANRPNGKVLPVLATATFLLNLFFHPTAETLAGHLLLAWFFIVHWQPTLIIDPRVHALLSPAQNRFLLELQQHRVLNTGDTRLLLDNDAAAFQQLLDHQLADYDSIAREVLVGKRLLSTSGAGGPLGTFFAVLRRGGWIALGCLYFLLPDLLPGPIDDMIVLMVTTGAGLNLFRWRR